MQNIISIANLHKSFKNNEVLKGINLEVKKGEILSIVGKSGCGKTTLLRCINFLEIPDQGTINVNGVSISTDDFPKNYQNIEKNKIQETNNPFKSFSYQNEIVKKFKNKIYQIRGNIGFLFQDLQLFPHYNVIENVYKPLVIIKKMRKEEAILNAEKILLKVNLINHRNKYPHQLSGGQKQRVAIARALAMSPKIMLYDEPTSALDPKLVREIADMINMLEKDEITQVIVSHDINFIKLIAKQVVFIDEGEIVEMGLLEKLLTNPVDQRTKHYFDIFR
jgi:ABC-type polar amino acid transport system ATPase subunit